MQGLSQHCGLANSAMVPACYSTNVKMVVLNGFYIIPRKLYRYTIHGRHREMDLAALRDVSLKQTRELANQWRSVLRQPLVLETNHKRCFYSFLIQIYPHANPACDVQTSGFD